MLTSILLTQSASGGSFTPPVFTFQFSPTTNPFSTPVWVDISKYVLDFSCKYGRQFELNSVEAGTATFTLDNTDRRFDPTNTLSPYYPNLLPLRKFQVTATFAGTTYYVFTGYIEQWPTKWQGPDWAEVDCTAVDAFEALSQADIQSLPATLTTTQGGNADLTFTSNAIGSGNNFLTIQYVSDLTLGVSMSGLAIVISIIPGTTTASQIMTAVNTDPVAGIFVTASLAQGSNGTGTPAVFGPTNLSGATFYQELTGSRINKVLDAVSWPAADRAIDAGHFQVAPVTFKVSDHQKAKLHINEVENSELGYTFVDPQGRIVYHDQTHRSTATLSTNSNGVFGDGGGTELEYSDLQTSYDKTYIYNYAAVTPNGASTGQISSDATSISKYMLRTYTLSSLLTSTADALSLAQYIVSKYKDPQLRISSMTIEPMNDTNLWLQVLQRTIGDRITVVRRPPTHGSSVGPPISTDCFVESIAWQLTYGDTSVSVTWELSPSVYSTSGLKLDDSTYGKLDTGTNTLNI